MDASQFKRLFIPHSDQLYRTALRLTNNRQAAEDLVQDTFLRLWTRRNDLPGDISSVGYALTTMRRIYYDGMRQGHINEIDKPADNMAEVSDTDISRQTETIDIGEKLKGLMLRLPDNQRQVMMMRDMEGLSSSQIRELTGLSEVNVRTLLCRARATVRKQLKQLLNYGCK